MAIFVFLLIWEIIAKWNSVLCIAGNLDITVCWTHPDATELEAENVFSAIFLQLSKQILRFALAAHLKDL